MSVLLPLTILAIFSRRRRKPLEQLEDSELLQAFNDGYAEAFSLLVSRFERPLFFFIVRRVQDEELARDILQDTFMKLSQHAHNYDSSSPVSAWLYTIARNRSIDHLRKRKHKELSLDQPLKDGESATLGTLLADQSATSQDRAEAREIAERIDQALDEINRDQKESFILREVHGLQFNEIAQLLSISENTVKSRYRYALEGLRKRLHDYVPTLPYSLQPQKEEAR